MSTREPAPRRRLDVSERTAAILEAARAIYAEESYADVPTSRIAEASGSSSGLVFHYFGSKAGLYAAAVRAHLEEVRAEQENALAALPPGTSARDRVRTWLGLHLDHVAADSSGPLGPLSSGTEPPEALEVRRDARLADVEDLRNTLGLSDWPRHEFAVWGFFGFVDRAARRWAEQGCPDDKRPHLEQAALGALEGALGDWAG